MSYSENNLWYCCSQWRRVLWSCSTAAPLSMRHKIKKIHKLSQYYRFTSKYCIYHSYFVVWVKASFKNYRALFILMTFYRFLLDCRCRFLQYNLLWAWTMFSSIYRVFWCLSELQKAAEKSGWPMWPSLGNKSLRVLDYLSHNLLSSQSYMLKNKLQS